LERFFNPVHQGGKNILVVVVAAVVAVVVTSRDVVATL
jgi:hypothetical protein